MAIDDQIKDEKLQYINRDAAKYHPYHKAKLISMNIVLVKKCFLLIKNK